MIDRVRFEALAAAEGFALTEQQLEQFDQYAEFLVEYNEKVNLTAITDPEGIEIKHFLDSLLLLKAVKLGEGASVIDVGTGAGFPSVPAKIVREDLAHPAGWAEQAHRLSGGAEPSAGTAEHCPAWTGRGSSPGRAAGTV